ncbi:feruloyl-CoA synthase [Variovorax sp. WDL1]|nr:hypothetical protein CHC07_00003 [Variovorax sp. B4]PNG61931.1 hypothetical protein CHC06_01833 [Variovorax sp. B2]VTV11990.1 feruloyl-CoA synthase [Variovorax sp. WDL1]
MGLGVELVSRLAPLVQDVVITGHDRDAVGMLVFPSAQAGQRPREELTAALLRTMRAMHDEGAGSSRCPVRALVLTSPPDIDAGEITDKGYINQRAVLLRRAAEVERLHADVCDPEVVRGD